MGFGGFITTVLEIAADPSKAIAAIEELKVENEEGAAEVSGTWSTAMSALLNPTTLALGAVTGLGGAMFELGEKSVEAGNKIYEASEKTGLSAEALSGVMAIAKTTGKSFESLSTAFGRASVNLAKATETGKGAIADLFTTAELQSLKFKPVDEQMQIVLKRIFALNDVGEHNLALQTLLGRGWQDNVEVLKMLAEQGLDPAIAKSKELGLYYGEDAAKKMHNLTLEWEQWKASMESFGLTLGQKVVPAMTVFLEDVNALGQNDVGFWETLIQKMRDLAGVAIIDLSSGLDAISLAMGKGRSAATLYGESLIMNRDYIQRMTDQMVRGLPLLGETTKATEGAAKAHEHAAKAVKAHAEATRDLAPLLPPVVQAMMDIEKSRADAAIRALAEALLDETEAIKKMGMAIKFSLPFNPSMFKPFVDGFHQLTAAERAALPTQREIAIVLKDLLKTYPDLTQAEAKHRAEMLAANPEIRKIIDSTTSETRARRELTKAIKDQSEAEGQLMNQERALESFTNSFTDSIEKQVAAIRADMAASVQGIAATTAALILGKRAQAAVEGTFDTAKAIESFAKYAESHYTDAAYLEAAIQYGLSAAQMFVVAGSGGGSIGSRGGGGGSYASASPSGGRAPGSSGPQAAGAMGTTVPITPGLTSVGGSGGGPTIKVAILNDSQYAQHVAGVLTNYTQRQGGQLVASHALNPVKAGR